MPFYTDRPPAVSPAEPHLKQRISVNALDQSGDRETNPIVLVQLSLADRRQVLAAQAAVMVAHYEQDNDWREFTAV